VSGIFVSVFQAIYNLGYFDGAREYDAAWIGNWN
jgi:hypothetical protein